MEKTIIIGSRVQVTPPADKEMLWSEDYEGLTGTVIEISERPVGYNAGNWHPISVRLDRHGFVRNFNREELTVLPSDDGGPDPKYDDDLIMGYDDFDEGGSRAKSP